MKSIRNVLICGGGLMGKNIAFAVSSSKEYLITVYDITDLDVEGDIRKNMRQLIDENVITNDELDERISRISFTKDLDSEVVKNADLVIEAVYEDMKLKQDMFRTLEEKCNSDCIFCTNSSVMSPSEISAKLKNKARFVGTHFWNPAHLIPLVEVVKTDATDEKVVDSVMEFMQDIGKMPCLCRKDVPGFIANRLQHALWREAISIVENGIADAETVDKAIKNSFGLRLPQLAPLENSDMVGTDLTYNIHKYLLKNLEDSHEPSKLIEDMLAEGKKGFKSGEGFYKWSPEDIQKCNEDLNKYLIKMLYRQ